MGQELLQQSIIYFVFDLQCRLGTIQGGTAQGSLPMPKFLAAEERLAQRLQVRMIAMCLNLRW
jgi:hypothetical protein